LEKLNSYKKLSELHARKFENAQNSNDVEIAENVKITEKVRNTKDAQHPDFESDDEMAIYDQEDKDIVKHISSNRDDEMAIYDREGEDIVKHPSFNGDDEMASDNQEASVSYNQEGGDFIVEEKTKEELELEILEGEIHVREILNKFIFPGKSITQMHNYYKMKEEAFKEEWVAHANFIAKQGFLETYVPTRKDKIVKDKIHSLTTPFAGVKNQYQYPLTTDDIDRTEEYIDELLYSKNEYFKKDRPYLVANILTDKKSEKLYDASKTA